MGEEFELGDPGLEVDLLVGRVDFELGLCDDADVSEEIDHAGVARLEPGRDLFAHFHAGFGAAAEVAQDAVDDPGDDDQEEGDVDEPEPFEERFFVLHDT